MAAEQFSLVWNSFPRNLSSGLYNLFADEQLVDVTLAADGQILRAHKLILSVCSTYFKEIFKMNSCKHPIVILKDVNYRDLSAMLHFMYQGEVNIKQEDLASFLNVAETLQIKGLTKENTRIENNSAIVGNNLFKFEEDRERKSPDYLQRFSQTEPKSEANTLLIENEKPDRLDNPVAESYEPKTTIQNSSSVTECSLAVEEVLDRRETFSRNRLEEFEERIFHSDEEPLDYTSDTGKLTNTKNEPVDYTSDVDFDYRNDSSLNIKNNSVVNDRLPNSRIVTHNTSNRDEPLPFVHLEASFHSDFGYETGSYDRDGKTTKTKTGGSSLPLETTLRVVSELDPTLRVERGKVTRMYSCPWCLRHFTRKENLKLHVRYIHGPLESLTCKLCGNKYKNKNSLRVHAYLYHNTRRNKLAKPGIIEGGI